MKNNSKGFTLAEVLSAVAIIAVLTAISIPIFSAQLEKSREAADAANIRSQYAEVMTDANTGSSQTYDKIVLQQKKPGWQNITIKDSLSSLGTLIGEPGNRAWVEYHTDTQTVSIHFDTSDTSADENNRMNFLPESMNSWKINNASIKNGKATLTFFTSKDSLIRIGGDNSTHKINLEAGKKYTLSIAMDSITTPVILKLTNRNGNNTYMTQNICTSGSLNFDYTHEAGRDNDVRISLTIPKNASVPGSAVITSVSLFEVK